MKMYLYILIICLSGADYAQSQEIFSEQVWELTEDINRDGWVDQGDIVSFEVKVTHNGEATQSISIENLLEDDGLELISGSVKSSNGTTLKGNKEGDASILIEDVTLSAPWGYATVTFSAKVISDTEIALAPISNHTSLITSIGPITSNSISLPRRTDYSLSQSRFGYRAVAILGIILFSAAALAYYLRRAKRYPPYQAAL